MTDTIEMTAAAEYIFAGRGDGLGGRFFNLLWSWRFAKSFGAKTVIFWPGTPGNMTDYFGHDFRACQIFDLYLLERAFPELKIRIVDGKPPMDHDLDRLDQRPKWKKKALKGWLRDDVFGGRDAILYTNYKPLIFVGEKVEECEAELHELFKQLPLSKIVVERVEAAKAQLDLQNIVGMHYRRGDIVGRLGEFGRASIERNEISPHLLSWITFYIRKCAPAVTYVEQLNRAHGLDSRVLLFSDDSDAINDFAKYLSPDRIITLAPYLKGLTPIQVAMVEMLCMAATKTILSTNSGFSMIASLIGKKPIELVKFQTTPEAYFEDFGRVSGFNTLAVGDELLASVVEMILTSPMYLGVAEELGWDLTGDQLARFITSKTSEVS